MSKNAVHITMVNGGPVIGLYCESEVSDDGEIDDIGQLNAYTDESIFSIYVG
jgi:hypothetical protein